jgi:hypothetical protein
MSGVIGFIIGLMSGGMFGVITTALVVAGRDEYYYWEKPE